MRGEIKLLGCVIVHCVQFSRLVENRLCNPVVLVVRRADAKEIRNDGVGVGKLPEGPSNYGSVIAAQGEGPLDWLPANMG